MAVKITHEPADMRRHLWIEAPLRVFLDGVELRASAWSVAGVVIDHPVHPGSSLAVGQTVSMRLDLPFQGFDIGFPVTGEVESWDPTAERAVIGFRGLGAREHDLLAHFVENMVRGTMISVDDTIYRLGGPISADAGMTSSGASIAAAGLPPALHRRGRPGRALLMTALYGITGAVVFGYLATLVYSNVYWLEAQTSAISAPVETLVSLGDGFVSWSSFKPGETVKAGDVVLNVYDNVLEREIEEAEITVRERENKLAYLIKRQENEKKKMGTLADLSTQKSLHLGAEIDGLSAKLKAANRELKSLPGVAVGPIAQVRQRIVGLKQAIALKHLEMTGRAAVAEQSSGKFEVVGQNVVGELDNLSAQIELAEADIAIAARRHQSYLNQRDRMAVRAPFDGVLRYLPRADNSTVKKGDVAAVIEQTADRGVTAYLRQDQLLRVQLGAPARVYVPATRQTFLASVSEIEPSRGALKEPGRYAGAQGPSQRSDDSMATVRLTLTTAEQVRDSRTYHDGLPVVTMIELGRPGLGWRSVWPDGPAQAQPRERSWGIGALFDSAWASIRRPAPALTPTGVGG